MNTLLRRVRRLPWWLPPAVFVAVGLYFALDSALHAVGTTQPVSAVSASGDLRLIDFRDTVWIPVRDLLHGHDPYDVLPYLHRHPSSQAFELYAPWHLLLTAPFALLPWGAATVTWSLARLGVYTAIAAVAAHHRPNRNLVWLLAAALMVTLPIRAGYLVGQITPEIVLGTVLALRFARTRPWLAAAGLVLAGIKPTFLPLLVIALLLTRAWGALVRGAVLGVVLGLPATIAVTVIEGGPGPLLTTLRAAARHASDADVDFHLASPAQTRVDLSGLFGHLGWIPPGWVQTLVTVAAAGLVVLVVLVVRRRRPPLLLADPVTVAVLCGATLAGFPHGFDMTLLVVPLVALAVCPPEVRRQPGTILVGIVCLLPFLHPRRLDGVVAGHPVSFSGSTAVDAVLVLLTLVTATAVALGYPRGANAATSSLSSDGGSRRRAT